MKKKKKKENTFFAHPEEGTHRFKFYHEKLKSESESHSVVSDYLRPHGLYNAWDSPGHNTGVGNCSLIQGIFRTPGSNPGLPHCRQILYQLSHHRSPRILEWVVYPFSRGSSWPRIELGSPALQADSLSDELPGKPMRFTMRLQILWWDCSNSVRSSGFTYLIPVLLLFLPQLQWFPPLKSWASQNHPRETKSSSSKLLLTSTFCTLTMSHQCS